MTAGAKITRLFRRARNSFGAWSHMRLVDFGQRKHHTDSRNSRSNSGAPELPPKSSQPNPSKISYICLRFLFFRFFFIFFFNSSNQTIQTVNILHSRPIFNPSISSGSPPKAFQPNHSLGDFQQFCQKKSPRNVDIAPSM